MNKSLGLLVKSHLAIELRNRHSFFVLSLFLLVSVFSFMIALPDQVLHKEYVASGIFWSLLLLASSMVSTSLFSSKPYIAWTDGLMLAGHNAFSLFLCRYVVVVLFMTLSVFALGAMLLLFLGLSITIHLLWILGYVLLAIGTYASLTTLFSSMLAKDKAGDLLLPALLLPISLPILIICVQGSARVLMGQSASGLYFLLGFAMVMIPCSLLLGELVIDWD